MLPCDVLGIRKVMLPDSEVEVENGGEIRHFRRPISIHKAPCSEVVVLGLRDFLAKKRQ